MAQQQIGSQHGFGPRLSRQLKRLPGNLVLALVNATAILVILAAVLALVAMDRVESAAGNVTAAISEAVAAHLPEAGPAALKPSALKPAALKAQIAGLRTDLAAYRESAGATADAAAARLNERIAGLEMQLAGLEDRLEALTRIKADVARDTVREAGAALGRSLSGILACGPPEPAA